MTTRARIRTRRQNACATGTGGFTLIEVLVALFILLLGIGAVMYLFPASLSAAREAAERTRTSQTAHSVISQIRASTAESLYNERLLPELLTQERTGANIYGYSTSIQRLAGASEVYLQRVTFAVTLANGSTETFTTFVAQH
jgi:prepilin-type N-terminal cleavage/methylation domain-containing protein